MLLPIEGKREKKAAKPEERRQNRTQEHRCNDEVAKWARIECKSYKVDGGFTVER